MRRNPWFETVAEARRRAKRQLPGSVFKALVAGSERGRTLADNVQAFAELGFAPRVAGHQAERDLSTTVLGLPVAMPVLISPTGVQAVHPDGEVAVARAAANRGVLMGLSSFAGKPVEEVVAAQPDTLFQMYWSGTREVMLQRMERARAAGVKALILTLDWSFSHGRDWGSPAIPDRVDLRTMAKFAPDVLPHPAWLLRYARTRRLPDLTTPNYQPPGGRAPTFFGAYGEWMQTPPPTWDDVAWLVREWAGPLLLKGVTRVDDARRAVDAGVAAISVSNHGGNNLDTTPATIRVLPAIAAAVGDQIEVLLDGGVRRGGDVAKALALGARAVMIGRAYLWGLAANGQAGVENVLDIMRGGLDSAVLGLGHGSVHELSADDLVVPDGFARVLGGGGVAGIPRQGGGAGARAVAGASASVPPSGGEPADHSQLAHLAWPEIPAGSTDSTGPTVLVPLGSTEQHGPHLPVGTDGVIARAVADRVAAASGDRRLVVAPLLAYGSSGEHAGFAGTVSIGREALASVLVETVRSLAMWAGRVVFVNGHGGNEPTLAAAVATLRAEGHAVSWVSCSAPEADPHAGVWETSVMLHLAPRDVRMDAAVAGDVRPIGELMPELVAGGVRAVSPSGVLGDPAGASAERGEKALAAVVAEVSTLILADAADSRGRLTAVPDGEAVAR